MKSVNEFAKNKIALGFKSEITPNILIVDDRKENLLATEKVLKSLPTTIFTASSGNEALSLMLRYRFAVILLDVQMPEMDGFEVAMLMQEHEAMRNIPIIFVTAISKEEKYATQAAEIGAVDYIFKPINSEILKSKVKMYIDLYKQREEILRLNTILQQSNEELERFAYICSHDMQEPVRMINSYAKILEQHCADKLDDDGKKFFHYIIAGAQHLHKMIQDILIFSRIGREEIQLETVDCEQVLQEVLLEFAPVIEQKHAHIEWSTLPTIEINSTLMRVLLQNLLGNALKFQIDNTEPAIKITAEPQENAWQFCVQDNGIGIDPRFHDKVFAIFQRLHRKEQYPGTGIGLSTCKKFIELCGGKIWFESTPNEGTKFYFIIHEGGTRNL
ncbi:MAG: response regulator [Legionellales bacterium]|nr:response regulator [Legionellales bacterium]